MIQQLANAQPNKSPQYESAEGAIPTFVGSHAEIGLDVKTLMDGRGGAVAAVSQTTRALQSEMVRRARAAFTPLRSIDDRSWIELFHSAANILLDERDGTHAAYVAQTSRATGLPHSRIKNGLEAVARTMKDIEGILCAQSPNGALEPYRTWQAGRNWNWIPCGTSAAINIPSNFPTINTTWIQVLAMRRPIVLVAHPRDPFTPTRIVASLYAAGLEDGAISVVHGSASALFKSVDQSFCHDSTPVSAHQSHVKVYHQGRSKVVLADVNATSITWQRLAAIITQGSGRLCTCPSALLTTSDVTNVAKKCAEALGQYQILPLEDTRAYVPAFPVVAHADEIVRKINAAIRRGAIDMSAEITGQPLSQEVCGLTFLRPTVLLIDPDDPLFGAELPFPFITVAQVTRTNLRRYAGNSLLVATIGASPDIVADLIADPSIDKVFSDDQFDRDYDPKDPHEGYIADFLFTKKAVYPSQRRQNDDTVMSSISRHRLFDPIN